MSDSDFAILFFLKKILKQGETDSKSSTCFPINGRLMVSSLKNEAHRKFLSTTVNEIKLKPSEELLKYSYIATKKIHADDLTVLKVYGK